jgi:hypothetical protein
MSSRGVVDPAVVGRMHTWFESMRVPGGYGGPVSHWWRHSLRYAGPGLDWRYEGIVHGYLNLYESTGDDRWLDSAVRAGTDLVDGQLETGNFRASAFERNPEVGGTPHEACASGALARLARVLREVDREWAPFARTARRSLQWHVDALWHDGVRTFSDTIGMDSFVPNKIASTIEALLAFAQLSESDGTLVDRFVLPAAETILELQVDSGEHEGAIHQLCTGDPDTGGDGKFFPLYVARCVSPLLAVYDATGEERFRSAAVRAGAFLARVERDEGSFPQVVYEGNGRNVSPRWIAGVGDVLRAYDALAERGMDLETAAVETWLGNGFDECGAFRTAAGFGQLSGHDGPVLTDVVHVVGWNDKAFRWLTDRVDGIVVEEPSRFSVRCSFDGTPGRFLEDGDRTEFVPGEQRGRTYRWDKESQWAEVA